MRQETGATGRDESRDESRDRQQIQSAVPIPALKSASLPTSNTKEDGKTV